MLKPRSIETCRVRSRHSDLAPLGEVVFVTPEEAEFLQLVGRAELVRGGEFPSLNNGDLIRNLHPKTRGRPRR